MFWNVVWLLMVAAMVALSIWLIVRFGERRHLPSRRPPLDSRDDAGPDGRRG